MQLFDGDFLAKASVCSQCGGSFFNFGGHSEVCICTGCKFAAELISQAKGHCARLRISRYKLCDLPSAVRRLEKDGWRLSVRPVRAHGFSFGNIVGVEDIEVELASIKSTCTGMPIGDAANYTVMPTADQVCSDRQSRCATCPFRKMQQPVGAHKALLGRCIASVREYDNEAVPVTVKRSEAPHIVAVVHELEAKGWNVHVNAFGRFPFCTLKLSKAGSLPGNGRDTCISGGGEDD